MSHKLTIELSASEHKRIKTAASMSGTTIKNIVLMAFEGFMQRKFKKVSKQRKGLKKFDSLDELFKDLGI